MIINGAVGNTAAYRIGRPGQHESSPVSYACVRRISPARIAIQGIAVQTSNYAPEFGQRVAASSTSR